MASLFSSLALFLFFHFASLRVLATNDVIEDGYTVTTVIDGHKLHINPRAVTLRPGSSDLLVLDSTKSAFYAVPFPFSTDSVKRFSGTGEPGYVDGEPGSVQFSHPRSFAIDLKGNVYVADRENNVIRKITDTGVTTTIAGVNGTNGHKDGPGQNATFSPDFELVFAEEICALLVADHGNQLVRRIDLKAEDCRRGSGSGSGSGVAAVSIWSVAVGAALLVGFAVGLALRPYILPHTGRHQDLPLQRDMEALPNQSGEASSDTLLRHQKRSC